MAFLSILFEGAPFILLGTLVSGFIDIYLPKGAMDKFLPKNKTAAVMVSGAGGNDSRRDLTAPAHGRNAFGVVVSFGQDTQGRLRSAAPTLG